MSTNPCYDVIVCTKNSAHTLGACLSALKRSDVPFGKIIVVDKHSLDETREIAERHRCIYVDSPAGLAEARIIGARLCETEYFINLDSDLIIPQNFHGILGPHVRYNFLTKGIYRNVLPKPDKTIANRDYNWMLSNVGSLDCCIIHRETFLNLSSDWVPRGLDAGEDTDLFSKCERLGLSVHQDSRVVSAHHVFSVQRLLSQTRWYGRGSRRGRIVGRFTRTRPYLLPVEMLAFPVMGAVEMFRFRSWRLFFYESAKLVYWMWGYLVG